MCLVLSSGYVHSTTTTLCPSYKHREEHRLILYAERGKPTAHCVRILNQTLYTVLLNFDNTQSCPRPPPLYLGSRDAYVPILFFLTPFISTPRSPAVRHGRRDGRCCRHQVGWRALQQA